MTDYKRICANCKWWEPDICCRYPPHPRYGSAETRRDCWCGEFALARQRKLDGGGGMSEFKPCPFCGAAAISFSERAGCDYKGDDVYHAFAGCSDADGCGIGFDLYHVGDDMLTDGDREDGTCALLERHAIEKWNRRRA